jgi:hypothetical protein
MADFYNSLISFDRNPARRAVLIAHLDDLSRVVHEEGAAAGVPVAEVYAAFNGPAGAADPIAEGYVISDNVHPSGAGQGAIARAFRQLGYAPLD